MTSDRTRAGLDAAVSALSGAGTIHVASHSAQGLRDALESALSGGLEEPGPAGPSRHGTWRLAIIDPTPARVALARKVIDRCSPWRGRNDVWFTGAPLLGGTGAADEHVGGRLAFLFPGFEPEPAGPVDDVADFVGIERPSPSRLRAPQASDEAIVNHAVDIVTSHRILAAALGRLGVHPDLYAGHSLGEWTAMIVAGICGLDDIDRLFAPVRSGRATFPDVAYAALGCGVDETRAAIAGLDGVHVSHDNCPHQCVVCGHPDVVGAALDRLKERGVLGQMIPFRSGFHTPLLAPCLEAGREGLAALDPGRPVRPVWSATSVAPYPEDPAALRDLVRAHLLRPVRFRELIEALYADGVRAFVQVGAGSLTGFVQDTLGGREHLAIAAQVPARPALAQLARVVSALWVEGATTAAEAVTPEAPAAPVVSPVLAAYGAAVADANAAMEAVMAAWRARPEPAAPRSVTRVFSLDTMPELRDHCLFRQAPDWPDDADAFPVVPMTTLLEIMREAALAAVPGRTVVAITDVRAHRWLAVAPPVTVTIEAAPLADQRVRVKVGPYAEGTVELALAHPRAPRPTTAGLPLHGRRTPPADGRSLYADGWMFHGPSFQGVVAIDAFGANGIRGTLRTLPASGALLDAAGQLAGHWAQAWAETDRLAFPVTIDAVRFFGPHPRPGDRVACAVEVGAFTDEWLRVDFELVTGQGDLWARIEGWTCRRFATDDVTWPAVHTRPSETSVGDQQPGGWCLVTDRWPDRASMEYTMRRYLCSAERAEFDTHNPRAQRAWLLGRIAAKDAARAWLWRRGSGPLWPAEFQVGNDASGRPWIRRHPARGGEQLSVSIAHTTGMAAAIVGHAQTAQVGIDVEAVASVTAAADAVRAVALTQGEVELLRRLSPSTSEPDVVWMTRFWTAKEAAGKALGTGLAGRPREFEVRAVEGDALLVAAGAPGRSPTIHRVHTRLLGAPDPASPGHVVAWTGEPIHTRAAETPDGPPHPRRIVRRR